MRSRSSRRIVAAALLAAGVCRIARAQPLPVGDETLVDAPPSWFYECPATAGRDDGRFALLYLRNGASGSQVILRAGADDGTLAAPVTLDKVSQSYGIVEALTATGRGYTALWREPSPPDKVPHITRPLDASGAPLGKQVSLQRKGNAITPRPGGGFIATWSSGGALFVQRLDGNGIGLGRPVKLRNAGNGGVVAFADGSFVVAWGTLTVRHDQWHDDGVFAQRFDGLGRPLGKPFQIVAPVASAQHSSFLIGGGGSEDLLAVMSTHEPDSVIYGHVTLSTFDRAGHRVGGPVDLTATDGPESYPQSIAVDPSGDVLAVWSETPDEYAPDAFARAFTRDLVPIGDAFHFAGAASAGHPAILCATAAYAGETWVISWLGSTVAIDDDDATQQVWVRRFSR